LNAAYCVNAGQTLDLTRTQTLTLTEP